MRNIGNKALISYSLLAFCLSFIGLPIYIYLPNYYADNFDVNLKTISVILLLTRLLDTLQDPIFGIVSDKLPGYKKRIICYLSPLLGISFLLLFYPLDVLKIEVWLTIFLIITYSIFSIIYINYQSYAVSFSKDYHVKTKITSCRELFFVSGIIFAAASPAILFQYYSEAQSFLFIGLGYLLLITIFAVVFFIKVPQGVAANRVSGSLKLVLKNNILRKYFAVFLLNSFSSAIPAALIMFFVDIVLGSKDKVGVFLLLYFFGLFIGIFVWKRVSEILNCKVRTFVISILFTAVVFIWCYFLGEGDILFYGIICVLSGVGFGGDFALAYSILTDIIQKEKMQNSESTIFGVTNFLIKISLTLSSVILIYLIGDMIDSKEDVSAFISFYYVLIPVILRILSAIMLHKYFKYINIQ